MKRLRASGNGSSVQLSVLERAGAGIDGTLSSGSHLVPGYDLALDGGMVVVFSWMGDGGGGQAGCCHGCG
jgi:hypothetical protein